MKRSISYYVIWVIFLFLLASLLNHTAWTFSKYEPFGVIAYADKTISDIPIIAWLQALSFEAAIAAITHKLSLLLGHYKKWTKRYLNVYTLALFLTGGVSALANTAHAVEFESNLKIFDAYGVPSVIYVLAFGTILPIVSMVFASILSKETTIEFEADNTVKRLNNELRKAKANLKTLETQRGYIEGLFAKSKRDRIVTARKMWPNVRNSVIVAITGASPSFVSDVLKDAPQSTNTDGRGGG